MDIDQEIEDVCQEIRELHSRTSFRQEEELQWAMADGLQKRLLDMVVKREVNTKVLYTRKNGLLGYGPAEPGKRMKRGRIDIVIYEGDRAVVAIEVMYPRGLGKTVFFERALENNCQKLRDFGNQACGKYILYFYHDTRNSVIDDKRYREGGITIGHYKLKENE